MSAIKKLKTSYDDRASPKHRKRDGICNLVYANRRHPTPCFAIVEEIIGQ